VTLYSASARILLGPQDRAETTLPTERMSFREQVRRWRRERGVTQAEMDAVIGKTGWTVQFESGRTRPPPRDVCVGIAKALGLDLDEVWWRCAPERIEGYDPDLLEWHEQDAQRRASTDLATPEVDLIEQLRERGVPPDSVHQLLLELGEVTPGEIDLIQLVRDAYPDVDPSRGVNEQYGPLRSLLGFVGAVNYGEAMLLKRLREIEQPDILNPNSAGLAGLLFSWVEKLARSGPDTEPRPSVRTLHHLLLRLFPMLEEDIWRLVREFDALAAIARGHDLSVVSPFATEEEVKATSKTITMTLEQFEEFRRLREADLAPDDGGDDAE